MRTSSILLLTLLLGVSETASGCAGKRIELTQDLRRAAAVEWVFDAGHELVLDWWIYPTLQPSWISGGACTDGKLIVLSNLGGASETLTPARLYVLDIETGSVLKRIGGPTQTYWHEWVITPELAYFKRKGEWQAFDLQKGRVLPHPPEPGSTTLSGSTPLPRETQYERSTKLWRHRCAIGRHRVLLISEKRFGDITFELSWKRGEVTHTRQLCRLPNRPFGTDGAHLMINDEENLIFSWGGYVISVDLNKLLSTGD